MPRFNWTLPLLIYLALNSSSQSSFSSRLVAGFFLQLTSWLVQTRMKKLGWLCRCVWFKESFLSKSGVSGFCCSRHFLVPQNIYLYIFAKHCHFFSSDLNLVLNPFPSFCIFTVLSGNGQGFYWFILPSLLFFRRLKSVFTNMGIMETWFIWGDLKLFFWEIL